MRIDLIGTGVVPRYRLTVTEDALAALRRVEDCHRPAGGEARS
jgi:hypothetical protein